MAACSLCGSTGHLLIAKIEFWDIAEGELQRCDRCRHTQWSPPLSDSQIAMGCEALDRQQQSQATTKTLRRGFFRAFTKGLGLGFWFKMRRARIGAILELGPGDGYVSRGVQIFFPSARVTALDIVKSTLEFVETAHGYQTIEGTPESIADLPEKYDLVLARDILEHTQHPGKVMRLIYDRLNHGGYFHFITPNGLEDIWPFQMRWELTEKRGELLLNHFHYFDPAGFKAFLENVGFRCLRFYLYGFKWTRRGRGWSRKPAQMAPESQKCSAQDTIDANPVVTRDGGELGIRTLGKTWWTGPLLKYLSGAFWFLHHRHLLRLPAGLRIGHEIYGIVRK